MNAIGIFMIEMGLKTIKDVRTTKTHSVAEKYVKQLNDPKEYAGMSKLERMFKRSFVETHGILDKVQAAVPEGAAKTIANSIK